MYNIAQDNNAGGTKLLDQPTFNSIQPRTRFQLRTSQSGRIYYEVKQIGDANYPLSRHRNAVIPRAERLLFEQDVHTRPAASFKNHNRLSYCLNDAFTSTDLFSSDGSIKLEGTPPFQLKLAVKSVITSHVDFISVEVADHTWRVDLPEYRFNSVGPHHVSIVSIQDASFCTPSTLDPAKSSVWVDVAETAAITPFETRSTYCVGDVVSFQLAGNPPWTVGSVYSFLPREDILSL
jgi:nucleoporin POM152